MKYRATNMASGGACTAYYEHTTPPKTKKKLIEMWKAGELSEEAYRELAPLLNPTFYLR